MTIINLPSFNGMKFMCKECKWTVSCGSNAYDKDLIAISDIVSKHERKCNG